MVSLKRILPILREQGAGIIFISHKLDEIKELCDSIAVLRDGNLVRREQTGDVTIENMVQFMVGRDIHDEYSRPRFQGDRKLVLEIRDLSSKQYGEVELKGLNLKVYAGEIVGIFGLIGSGRTEMIKALHGLRTIQQGTVLVGGKQMEKDVYKRQEETGPGIPGRSV